jgi:hypothetical protein
MVNLNFLALFIIWHNIFQIICCEEMAAALFKSLTNFTRAKIFIGLQSRNKNNFEKVA